MAPIQNVPENEQSTPAQLIKDKPEGPGLYEKYHVVNNATQKTVYDCFVLRPVTDPNAARAMRFYANLIKESAPEFYADLDRWLRIIELETV